MSVTILNIFKEYLSIDFLHKVMIILLICTYCLSNKSEHNILVFPLLKNTVST